MTMRLRAPAAYLFLLAALAGVGWTVLAAAPATRPAAGPREDGSRADDAPAPGIEPYLGTWICREMITRDIPGVEPYPVERHLLFRWDSGRLLVKSVDYLPELRTWGDISDWNGETILDRWNRSSMKVTPRPDGTLFLSLSGTNGIGPAAARAIWWAAGHLAVEEDEEGPLLHMVTTQGYAPSSKGNAWRPLERVYRLVSREIDPRLARAHR